MNAETNSGLFLYSFQTKGTCACVYRLTKKNKLFVWYTTQVEKSPEERVNFEIKTYLRSDLSCCFKEFYSRQITFYHLVHKEETPTVVNRKGPLHQRLCSALEPAGHIVKDRRWTRQKNKGHLFFDKFKDLQYWTFGRLNTPLNYVELWSMFVKNWDHFNVVSTQYNYVKPNKQSCWKMKLTNT